MSMILQTIISAISGAFIGAFFFSIGSVVAMYFYIWRHGYFGFDFLGPLEKPYFWAFIFGTVLGIIEGFFTGITIGSLGLLDILKGLLVGFIVNEIIFLAIISISEKKSPIFILSSIFYQHYEGFKFWSLTWFLPSIITGALVVATISFIKNTYFRSV